MNKTEALMKNLLYEKVTVIHADEDGTPTTVAFVEVKKDATTAEKLKTAFMKTNSITDAWWNNEGVTKMFVWCQRHGSGRKYKCEQ